MSTKPNFKREAETFAAAFSESQSAEHVRHVTHLLRQHMTLTWNARGRADREQVVSELTMVRGRTLTGPAIKTVAESLRTLDR